MNEIIGRDGSVIGKGKYINGKLHGRCIKYYQHTFDIEEDHNYIHGVKHGKCIKHAGAWRRETYYEYGEVIQIDDIFETDG